MELQIKHVKKSYGHKQALKDVNLLLSPGIYGLLGPNGAGKSTLMNILAGNLSPTAGEIYLDGMEIRKMGKTYRQKLGYMPQQQVFYPGFTAEQFLFYIASLKGMKREEAQKQIDWALTLLSLSDVRSKPIRSFSGGMKQRLLLAQAILNDPDILILDEPTAGLDPKQRIAVRNLIGQIALNKIVILSTHVVSDIEFIAKELILLSDGQLIQQGTPKQFLAQMDGSVWEAVVPEDQVTQMSQYGTICGVARDQNGIFVRLLSEKKPDIPCTPGRSCLEDVYLHYFGEEGL